MLTAVSGCGASETDYDPRAHSALVEIQRSASATSCIATAIGPTTYATAAHCVFDRQASQMNLMVSNGGSTAVTAVAIHPDFDINVGQMDIAVLEAEQDLGLAPLRIASTPRPTDTEEFLTNSASDPSGALLLDPDETLRSVTWTSAVCADSDDTSVCAVPNGDTGMCEGDSGTPLVVRGDDDEWELIGVLSRNVLPNDVGPCSTGGAVFAAARDITGVS